MGKETLSSIERKIKSVSIQGARNIAIFSLRFLRDLAKEKGFRNEFTKASKKLEKARPTAVVLHNCLKIIREERSLDSIDSLLKKLEESDEMVAETGLKILRKKKYKILTHCHSTEALSVIKGLNKKGKSISVIATQTDPLEQGIKTVKELSRENIPVELILDSAVGYFMPDIDIVIVGTDSMRPEGVVNKIGTKMYAIVAKEHKKHFFVVGNTLKIDKRKSFRIEERPAKEVMKEIRTAKSLKGVKIRNPAFDITPWKYVSKIITDEGILTPQKIKREFR